MKRILITTTALLFAATAFAGKAKIEVKALGNAAAPAGGTFYKAMNSEPEKLNPLTSSDLYASIIQGFTMDSLMTRDADTYEWVPAIAESFEEDKNGKWIKFKIRKGVKFHDGKPVTVEDIQFSLNALKDPKFDTAHARPYYENLEKIEKISDNEIKFHIKKKYFGNFAVAAGLTIVPKHVYGDPKKKNGKTLVGTGPYKLHKYKKGKSIILKRNKDWWGNSLAYYAGAHKPEKIFYRFIKDDTVQMEQLKKGKVDFLGMSPEQYTKKAVGKKWGKKVFKQKVENSGPKGYGFVGWNLKHDFFKDRDVRVALAHLMNRDVMNKKFRYGMSLPATGPWYQQSPYASKTVKAIPFDLAKAGKLLKKAGWKDTDKDGVLDKMINGQKRKFEFSLMFSNPNSEKYFTVYKEDMKKAGIIMHLKRVEWSTFISALDGNNKDPKKMSFDAVSLGWSGGSVDLDPKQIWHSKSAVPGGSNFTAYKNAKVDKLIDKARGELNKAKRIKMMQKIYEEIAKDAPYAFMFNEKYSLYGHTKKMKFSKPTYNYDIGADFWWIEK